MIVVNKIDLLNDTDSASLVSTLRRNSRDGVQVLPTTMGALPVDVLLGQGARAEADMDARHEHHHHDDDHHDHDAFESFVVTRPEITDPQAFAAQIADVIRSHDILRLKGFAAVTSKPMRLTLQAVGPRVETYFDRPLTPDEPRQTRLVVIGRAGLDRAAISAALSA